MLAQVLRPSNKENRMKYPDVIVIQHLAITLRFQAAGDHVHWRLFSLYSFDGLAWSDDASVLPNCKDVAVQILDQTAEDEIKWIL